MFKIFQVLSILNQLGLGKKLKKIIRFFKMHKEVIGAVRCIIESYTDDHKFDEKEKEEIINRLSGVAKKYWK